MLLLVMVFMGYALYTILVPWLQDQERQSALISVYRVNQQFDRDIAELDELAHLLAGSNSIRSLLGGAGAPAMVAHDDVDLWLVTDRRGALVMADGHLPGSDDWQRCDARLEDCRWLLNGLPSLLTRRAGETIFNPLNQSGMGGLNDRTFFMLASYPVQAGTRSEMLGRVHALRFIPKRWRIGEASRQAFIMSLDSSDAVITQNSAAQIVPVSSRWLRARLLRQGVVPGRTVELTASVSRSDLGGTLTTLYMSLLAVGALLLTTLLAMLILFRTVILRPITRLSDYARRLRDNIGEHLEAPPAWLQGRDDELGVMAREFQHLIHTLDERNAHLKALSQRDALTGLSNRRLLDRQLPRTLSLTHRLDRPVALIMIDVDHFKLYNDCYGHPEGDECLKMIAATLRDIFQRDSDLIARIGGEEFVIVLPDFDEHQALEIACGLCTAIKAQCMPHERSPTHRYVTISAGIAVSHPDEPLSGEALLKQADEALYEIKKSGRDAVGGVNASSSTAAIDALFDLHGTEHQ